MVNLPWTKNKPSTPGIYLYKPTTQWVWYVKRVTQGKWQHAEDPNELYMGLRESVGKAEYGWWCGPLEEPKEDWERRRERMEDERQKVDA